MCHQGGSEAPSLCVTHGCLSVYGCRTPATVLGSHQHPTRGTQWGAGGWQPSCPCLRRQDEGLAGAPGQAGAPDAPGMQQDESWDAADNTMVWLSCWMQHPSCTGTHLFMHRHGWHVFVCGGIVAPRRADGHAFSQVQPVACENSEDRSITRVDEGLEDFFAKRLIAEALP